MMVQASHEDWQSLIPEYVSGTLAAAERARFDEHAAACPECRALVVEAGQLQSGLRLVAHAERALHPGAAEINDYVENSQTLNAATRDNIARHLLLCPDCGREVALLTELAQEQSDRSTRQERSAQVRALEKPRVRTNFWGIFRHPGFAYGLAAIFLVLLVTPLLRKTIPGSTNPLSVDKAILLAPQTRGSLRPTEVTRHRSDKVVRFALLTPFRHGVQATATLVSGKDRELLQIQLENGGDENELISLTVPAALLGDGEYSFKLTGINSSGTHPDTTVAIYPFLVSTSSP